VSLVLHGYWRSGAAYRVRIALNLKGLAYEQRNHDLRTGAHRDRAYLGLNPQGLVPALETPHGLITQSVAIMEALDEGWPEPPLLPRAPGERALVRAMVGVVACDIHPLNNLRVLQVLKGDFGADQPRLDAWAARWIAPGFEALETMIAQYGAGWSCGDTPTLADCCLVPQVYSAARFNVDLSPFPRILEIEERAARHPAFAAAHPSRQPDADAA
jgi:maleylpyruvate isomerase